ncbi:MAG: anti-sigma factor [Mariniblastus sp.]
MSDALNNEPREQLLIAYLDGELDAADRAKAESLLASNPEYVQLVDQWKENGGLLRSMPRYQLDSGFATRVLNAIDAKAIDVKTTGSASLPALNANVSDADNFAPSLTLAHASAANQPQSKIAGLALIGALAAMLLLTLFVFPSFVEPPATASVEPSENKTESVTPPEPGANLATARPPVPNALLLNSRVEGSGNESKPIGELKFLSQNSGINELLWIESESPDNAIELVATVFAKHSIPFQRSTDKESKDFEAIHIVSTVQKMQKAIKDLSSDEGTSVRKFVMPVLSSAVTADSTSAQLMDSALVTQELAGPEIEAVNKHFNLLGENDKETIVQYLLMIGKK